MHFFQSCKYSKSAGKASITNYMQTFQNDNFNNLKIINNLFVFDILD